MGVAWEEVGCMASYQPTPAHQSDSCVAREKTTALVRAGVALMPPGLSFREAIHVG